MRGFSPAGEVLVAVEQAGGSVQRVAGVVDGGALLGRLVGGAEEDPLLGGRHLGTRVRLTAQLQLHRQAVQFHTKLPATQHAHLTASNGSHRHEDCL